MSDNDLEKYQSLNWMTTDKVESYIVWTNGEGYPVRSVDLKYLTNITFVI